MQLISNTSSTLTAISGINAGGGGGKNGNGASDGGGGGGAGGPLLLEAPQVTIAGKLTVNGGGGGGTGTGNSAFAPDATLNRMPAPGGVSSANGSGGAGAATNVLDGEPGKANVSMDHFGAGGGGTGRIRLHTRTGAAAVQPAAILSPSLADSPTSCTQGVAAVQ